MKVVILAGGYGTRIGEESYLKPKPMLEIGDHPILWHIMKIYAYHGFMEFVICLGYKGVAIKEYFEHYFLHESDVTFRFSGVSKSVEYHKTFAEPWSVTLTNTGQDTMTGGRIKRVQKYIGNEPFLLTYGDGVANVPIDQTIDFHRRMNKMVTVTAIRPPGRFGTLNVEKDSTVSSFVEKPAGDGDWINGGFFVCQPELFDYIDGDDSILEAHVIPRITQMGGLAAYKHHGFWSCMDTMRDKDHLNKLWASGNAPWKFWAD